MAVSTKNKKRKYPRGYRNYRIKYGPSGVEHQAYARKLSPSGLFIDTNLAVYPAGTALVLNIEIAGEVYCVQGIIRNARRTDARFIRLLKPGMGVEFSEISPEFRQAIAGK